MWFDRSAIIKRANECRTSLEKSYEYIKDIIKSENDNGIPTNRIVIGNEKKISFEFWLNHNRFN